MRQQMIETLNQQLNSKPLGLELLTEEKFLTDSELVTIVESLPLRYHPAAYNLLDACNRITPEIAEVLYPNHMDVVYH